MEQNINGINYQYQILRYRHDVVSGEFANLGIVFFDPSTNFLKAQFVHKYARLSHFFGNVSSTFLIRTLKQLDNQFRKLAKELSEELPLQQPKNIEELTTSILTPDDNALLFSRVYDGWHFEHDLAFDEIYHRIIEQYQDPTIERHDDSFAWKKIYKKHFDQYGITPKLKPRKVKTQFTSRKFEKTVPNGALHCFQSLSFDLKHKSSIEDKIFKWDGRIHELETSERPLKLYLLSVMPHDRQLAKMVENKLNFKSDNVEVQVVNEAEAEEIAQKINQILKESL